MTETVVLFRFGNTPGLVTILVCLFAGIWPRPAAGGDDVTLYLQWYHQFQFAGYYAALEQGFYREAGLDVAIVEGGPGVETFKEVAAAPGRYGTAHAAGLLVRRARGAPPVALASIFQHSPNVIIARADRGITTPHQLPRTRTIIWPGGDVELSAMLLNEGIDPSPFRQEPRGDNVKDLIEGKVDAIDGYVTDEAFTVMNAGVPVNIIRPTNSGVDFYGDTLITSERESRDHPDRVVAFREVSLRGWAFALDHPGEVIDLILSVYKAKKSREHLLYEAEETRELVMPELIEVGYMNQGRWARMADTLVTVGVTGPDATFGDYVYDPERLEKERLERIRNYLTWGPPVALVLITIIAGWGWAWSLRRSVARATQAVKLQGEIVGNMSEGVHLVRVSDGVVVYANPRLEAMFGYRAGELVGRHVSTINAAGDTTPAEVAKAIMAELERTAVWQGEIRNVRKDGTPFWCAANISTFDHPEFGEVWVSVHTDITEQKRVEEALRESEERLRRSVLEAPIPIMIHAGDGEVLMISNKWTELSGYAHTDIPTILDWTEKAYGRDKESMRGLIGALYEITEPSEGEAHVTTATGENRIWEFRTAPLGRLADGRRFVISMAIDATDRKRDEEALQQSEEAKKALLTVTKDSIFLLERDGTILEANEPGARRLGKTVDEMLGTSIYDNLPPEVARFRRALLPRIDAGETFTFEDQRDGMWFESSIHPVSFKDGKAEKFAVFARDITDRKALEVRLLHAQKLEAVGQLTAGVAHEFNNILQSAAGYMEFLEDEIGDDDKLRKLVSGASQSIWRGAEITKGLLAFGRKQLLRPRSIDLNEVISRMSVLFGSTSGGSVETRIKLAEDLWIAKVDPGQLETAVVNLALNARDAMPGGGMLIIETANTHVDDDLAAEIAEARPGDYVTLTMSDTGGGMSAEVLEHVFEPFFTTKDVGDGTGLGLSMIYGFAQQSNGFVTIDSELGRGTRVELYLPRVSKPMDRGAMN